MLSVSALYAAEPRISDLGITTFSLGGWELAAQIRLRFRAEPRSSELGRSPAGEYQHYGDR